MAKIYHYTSIDTLALILLNKTIRFNRLDKVDDEEESIFGSGDSDVKIGKYIFVSCWTKDPEENPTLWKYVEDNAGERNAVRIGLDEDMFLTYPLYGEQYKTYFPHDFEKESDCYFHNIANLVQLHDVQYVDDNKERIRELIKEGYDFVDIEIQELGLFKNRERWEKQKESRFRLIAFPTTEEFESRNLEMGESNVNFTINLMQSVVPLLRRNIPISLTYKDIPLKENVLKSIEVTMGPKTTDEDKAKVRRILYPCPISRFFSNRRIINSSLKDKNNKNNKFSNKR